MTEEEIGYNAILREVFESLKYNDAVASEIKRAKRIIADNPAPFPILRPRIIAMAFVQILPVLTGSYAIALANAGNDVPFNQLSLFDQLPLTDEAESDNS